MKPSTLELYVVCLEDENTSWRNFEQSVTKLLRPRLNSLLKELFSTGRPGGYVAKVSVKFKRFSSVSAGRPPATSICIIIDVPERGRPETIVIVSASGPQGGTISSCMSESTS